MALRALAGTGLAVLLAASVLVGGGVAAATGPADGRAGGSDRSTVAAAGVAVLPDDGGRGAAGPDAAGPDAAGPDARGPDARGPDADGPATHGLCTAWGRGGLGGSTARGRLETAAGGSEGVAAYCDDVVARQRSQGRPDHAGGPGVRTAEPPGLTKADEAAKAPKPKAAKAPKADKAPKAPKAPKPKAAKAPEDRRDRG